MFFSSDNAVLFPNTGQSLSLDMTIRVHFLHIHIHTTTFELVTVQIPADKGEHKSYKTRLQTGKRRWGGGCGNGV